MSDLSPKAGLGERRNRPFSVNPLQEKGVSLYVHLPYCASRCRYCDFNAWVADKADFTSYIDAVLHEARAKATGLKPQTVFFGGGTPSLFPKEELSRLFEELQIITGYQTSAFEITAEANPESFSEEKATVFSHGQVNRVSLGIQSLQPDILRAYDRAHSAEQALQALGRIKRVFSQCNVDMIYAFPGQHPESFFSDLEKLLAYSPDHFSCYELSYEPGTALTKKRDAGKWNPEDPDLCEKLFLAVHEIFSRHQYSHYEVSNFALDNSPCWHNVATWRTLDCVGLGAGAVGWESGVRQKNILRPVEYESAIFERGSATLEKEVPKKETILFDLFMMGLRMPHEGVSIERAERLTGLNPLLVYDKELAQLRQEGLLQVTPEQIRVTPKGLLLLDTVLQSFLPTQSV